MERREFVMVKSRTYIATPPGATIEEQLADLHINRREFASNMGMDEQQITALLRGALPLTADVAARLESILGVPADFWNRLEAIYREKLLKAEAENERETVSQSRSRMAQRAEMRI